MRLLGWLLVVGGMFVAWVGAMLLVAVLVAIPGDPGQHAGLALLCYAAGAVLALGAVGAAAASRRMRILLVGAGALAAVAGQFVPKAVTDPYNLFNFDPARGVLLGGLLLGGATVFIHLGAGLAMKPFPSGELGTSQEVMER